MKIMGFNFENATRFLIDSFTKANGYAPFILHEDPRWRERRDAIRVRLGMQAKS